jgi:hypothetical protein
VSSTSQVERDPTAVASAASKARSTTLATLVSSSPIGVAAGGPADIHGAYPVPVDVERIDIAGSARNGMPS